ncbi:unnamed protein product [Rhizophagus irregularis]|uniref:Uncharacterized protein n=1 Tax=Rhizophagus irregularis TaxID=588596 RepID=A0A915ZU59_9GLOM|nr:unnamed protein product [Rhizophagus irregularis]CAB5390450.1 unnamed protein product [Rhizophagus irregularis]
MPTKISMMCYIHDFTEQLTQEFTVKKIMAIARLNDDDLTKIVYLRFLKRKVRHLCQLLIDNMGFDNMPMIS